MNKPIKERLEQVIEELRMHVYSPGQVAVLQDAIRYIESMDQNLQSLMLQGTTFEQKTCLSCEGSCGDTGDDSWRIMLLAAYYNVVSTKMDDYGGNTAGLATYLQGVNDLADAMVLLSGDAEADPE